MNNNLEISIATSSGTRECFVCGYVIRDRTIMLRGAKTKEIVLHKKMSLRNSHSVRGICEKSRR